MSDDLVVQGSFQDRLKERIKDDIGDLITDEELSMMIQSSVNDIFFKPVLDRYNKEIEPSLLHGIVKELLEPQVREHVVIYMLEHKDDIKIIIKKVIEQGITQSIINSLDSKFQCDLMTMGQNIVSNIESNAY